MNNLIPNYSFILNEFRKLNISENFYHKPITPKLSDLEVIVLNITAEYSGISSEYQLFRDLKGTILEFKIERSVYNKRKRKLFVGIEKLRRTLVEKLNDLQQYFFVDSMPLEICKNARATRSRICKDQQGAFPNYGFCAAQNAKYYGYKLHAVCSVDGIFENFDLAPASVHDVHYLKDIQQQMSDCVILGDKGYLSQQLQLNLFETVNIKLETPMRSNQTGFKTYPYIFNKSRKRIETLFSRGYAISSRSGKIMPRRSWDLKQEY